MVVAAVALAAFAADCSAMSTPEQAMQCCKSMPCAPGSHQGQDCCKTATMVHAPFVQPSSAHGVSFAIVVFAVLPAYSEFLGIDSLERIVAAQSHAPPIFCLAAPHPLRI